MTDTDKLKRLADAVLTGWSGSKVIYSSEANAILALIAERDEAVTLLRDMDGVRMYDEEWAPVAAFLSRIDAEGSE